MARLATPATGCPPMSRLLTAARACAPRLGRERMLSLYVAVVVAVGLTVLVTTVAVDGGDVLSNASGQLWLFAILAAVGELTPIKIFRRGSEGEITLSTTFAFALLLLAGLPAALMALALASVVADVAHRKPVTKALFNVSQYALSMAAAGVVLDLISAVPRMAAPHNAAGDLPAILLSGVIFFAVNSVLVATVISLSQGFGLWGYYSRDLVFQASN